MTVAHLFKKAVPFATGWLQTICFINVFICKRKVGNFSCIEIYSESSLCGYISFVLLSKLVGYLR